MTLRILVVEDAAEARQMLTALLEAEGYAIRTAGDSDAALWAFAPRGQVPPDLLLSDLQTPGMFGWAALAALQEAHTTVPVIGISTDPVAAERAVAAGMAVALLATPFTPDTVLTLLRHWRGVADGGAEAEPASTAWLICTQCFQLFAREPLPDPAPTLCPTCQ